MNKRRVLSDLWGVASENEKEALANCVVKLVQNKTFASKNLFGC